MLGITSFLTAAAAGLLQPMPGGMPPMPQEQTMSLRIFISPAGEPFRVASGDFPSRMWFDLADANRDGRLTLAEMMVQARTFFDKVDLDRNGRIEGDEVKNYESRIAPETRSANSPMGMPGGARGGPPPSGGGRGPGGGGRGPGGGGPGEGGMGGMGGMGGGEGSSPGGPRSSARLQEMPRGAGRFSFFNFAEPIMRADTDLSRSVTKEEFDALQQEQFRALDKKHRGYLEFGDLPKTPTQGAPVKVKMQRQSLPR